MIPGNTLIEISIETQPSKDYRMNLSKEIITGYCDSIDAMKQVIFNILNTERYQNLIYSWSYGIELMDLFGEPITYVVPEIERRIVEALIQDDRINLVDTFQFDTTEKRKIKVTFTVHTTFGDISSEKVVDV